MSIGNGARAWRALFALLQSQKPWLAERLAAYDLTINLGHALHVIGESGEMTMTAFAAAMFVDASNATGLIDRLVRRGIVERRASETDRRAKVVRLTPAGKRLDRRVNDMLTSEAPPPIARLSAAEQATLRELLERAVAFAEGDG